MIGKLVTLKIWLEKIYMKILKVINEEGMYWPENRKDSGKQKQGKKRRQ